MFGCVTPIPFILTKVTITIYNESLERMNESLKYGMEQGFTTTLLQLQNLFSKF
ncbi:MAG TPA: hypothetical protein PLO59_02325 [Bacteroidia bacterium]|nr:hypothetical protein [Bacteroidia bacterium]